MLAEHGRRIKGGARKPSFPEEAESDEVLYRASGTKITSYQVYNRDGYPSMRVDLTGRPHSGIETPHVQEFNESSRVNPDTGNPFINKGTVRAATTEEIPTPSLEEESARTSSQSWTIWPD
jgi:hypothetical protein